MPSRVRFVAGVDVACDASSHIGFCAVAVCAYPSLEPVHHVVVKGEVLFPYMPGFLSFREGPIVCAAFDGLDIRPDVAIFDGQGIAHPQRLGIASHLGLILNLPTIGCAKTRLCGTYKQPGLRKGDRSYLTDDGGDPIGVVLRTRDCVRPVFVSPGHMIGIDEAAAFVLSCVRTYRIPEPLRRAHCAARAALRAS